jgi:hypothetical protein
MDGQWRTPNTDDVIGCDELPCVDVGVGVYHHPFCGLPRDEETLYGPVAPDEEETFPPDLEVIG